MIDNVENIIEKKIISLIQIVYLIWFILSLRENLSKRYGFLSNKIFITNKEILGIYTCPLSNIKKIYVCMSLGDLRHTDAAFPKEKKN